VFHHGDPKSLAARLDYWFEHRAVLQEAGRAYAASAKRYTVARSVRAMERVYQELAPAGHNVYRKCLLNRVIQRLFFSVVAVPLLFLWTRLFMGVRVKGSHNLYKVDGAITVCNHVHWFDAVLVGIAAFPRKPIYPTLRTNLESLFPGLLVHSLGGVPIPERMDELRKFMAEMEFALRDGRLVHMYPEGNLEPYSTELQDFKRGAFRLAAEARVPIIPITISFQQPHGLRKIYKWLRRKPLMFVNIDEPIMPESFDVDIDTALRLGEVRAQMEAELKQNTTAPAKPVKEDLVAA
jgi:1-acyl-sn-glycerol-3-phosphate acyltransferase